MANPVPAFPNTECTECCLPIPEGADMYFYLDDKLCLRCAEEQGIVCECGRFMNPDYDKCFSCAE